MDPNIEQNEEQKSNLPAAVKTPRIKRTVKKTTRKTKKVEVEEPAEITNSFHLVAFPNDSSSDLNIEQMVASLNVISSATCSLVLPPRYLNEFSRTTNGIKILPIPSASSPILIRMRDTYTDNLLNSLDFITANAKKCQIYGIHVKKCRHGIVRQVDIIHGISFRSFTYVNGLNVEKNELQFIDVVVTCTGLFEATTADVPDLKTYIAERFSL